MGAYSALPSRCGEAAGTWERTVAEAHTIAHEAEHGLLHALPHLTAATIHVDPGATA
jgi:Dimerisation domain of Zinc Transporter